MLHDDVFNTNVLATQRQSKSSKARVDECVCMNEINRFESILCVPLGVGHQLLREGERKTGCGGSMESISFQFE